MRPAPDAARASAWAWACAWALVCAGPGVAGAQPLAPDARAPAPAPAAIRALPIEDPSGRALDGVFAALRALEPGGASPRTVRILHFGDSALVADGPTGVVRARLAGRFGDAGPGFVAFGDPFGGYRRDGVTSATSGRWRIARPSRSPLADRRYGLDAFALVTSASGARAWMESSTARFSRAELVFDREPGAGAVIATVDRGEPRVVPTRGPASEPGIEPLELDGDGPHRIEVRTRGNGEVRLYGAVLERDLPGVVYEVHAAVGATARTFVAIDAVQMVGLLARRSPDLVLLQYGTNETADRPSDPAEYGRMLRELLARARRAAPSTSCLVVTPYDRAIATRDGWVSHPALAGLLAAARGVARDERCALWDANAAMGGPGSMARLADASPPLAARDRTHLRTVAARAVGSALADALLAAYDRWRAVASTAGSAPAPRPPSTAPGSRTTNGSSR